MKVKSLLIAAFAALSMSAVAGTFARDNVYIKDFEAKVGDEVTVDIYFDCETEYAGAQADKLTVNANGKIANIKIHNQITTSI